MSKIAFILTFPNCGSWNGKFSSTDKHYNIIKSVSTLLRKKLLSESPYFYNFSDGWTARIDVKPISEVSNQLKNSNGFMGYSWMIDSILNNGYITTIKEGENNANN